MDAEGKGSVGREVINALGGAALPDPVVRSAWKGISRLIGVTAEIPAAWLERYVAQIRAGTAARQTVSQAIARAAGDAGARNPALVDAALERWLPGELRKHDNKAAIANLTVERLTEEPTDRTGPTKEIDDDWLNIFEGYAENASSDRMRDLWARVLAGEIRKPGKFGLRTLAFMAELDSSVASIFEQYATRIIDDAIFRETSGLRGAAYHQLTTLAEVGLIKGAPSNAYQEVIVGPDGRGFVMFGPKEHINIVGEPNHTFRYDIYSLTRVGRELLSILPRPPNMELVRDWVAKIDKSKLTQITLRTSGSGKFHDTALWRREDGKR